MKKDGFYTESDQLAGYLLSSSSVSRPRKFSYAFLVPGGKETVTFRGSGTQDTGFATGIAREDHSDLDSDSGQEPPARDLRILPALHNVLTDDVVRFLSLAEAVPVDLASSEADVPCAQTKQHVSLTTTGAFCVQCTCPRALVPTFALEPSAPTHDFVPRYLHVENAIDHFASAHKEAFKGIGELVGEHNRKGICPPPPVQKRC